MSSKLLSDEAFQKLLFDLFCVWHDVQRHYDPPITDNEQEKMLKVKQMLCRLLGEIDGRVKRIQTTLSDADEQTFIEEWSMLTWNVLCIASRLQNSPALIQSQEDRLIFNRLNVALVQLVNHSRSASSPPCIDDPNMDYLVSALGETMHNLHSLYKRLKSVSAERPGPMSPEETEEFAQRLQHFADENLIPFVNSFKTFCTEQSTRLWQGVREAQIVRMLNKSVLSHAPINDIVSFYSFQMHRLAILGARLQGFRYELSVNKVFGDYDPVRSLSELVFSALELLMADCLLAAEPSTNPILVTNNLFTINCGALARGVVFKQFDIQVVTEETAEHVQSEMRRQKILPSPIPTVPSAALLALKPSGGTKRSNNQTISETSQSQAPKKSDVNSKEIVTIYPEFNNKNRYWAANKVMLCTTRQKGGKHSAGNSFQDLSPGGFNLDLKSMTGKRPIFYFYIRATMFSPSGRFADAHTLSLPFTIATRRNQDCQVQRMMSSYTATCFWLYGNNVQDGLLLQWVDHAMSWEAFKRIFMQYFRVHADVERGLEDKDFDLLQYKIICNDCAPQGAFPPFGGGDRKISFKNMLCPHLRYECASTNVRFSVWRGILELMQLFHDPKTMVRRLWERHYIHGFLEFDQVSALLAPHKSALLMHISFITGGTICFTLKSDLHGGGDGAAPMHLEPLDLKKLQAKPLSEYLRDIAIAEKVKYLINSRLDLVPIGVLLGEFAPDAAREDAQSETRISSNVTHSGDIDAMQSITFTAMRIAVVTCKVKPPSADLDQQQQPMDVQQIPPLQGGLSQGGQNSSVVAAMLTDEHSTLAAMLQLQQQQNNHSNQGPLSNVSALSSVSGTVSQKPSIGGGGNYSPTDGGSGNVFSNNPGSGLNSNSMAGGPSPQPPHFFNYRLPARASADDDFIREVIQLCNFHGKSKKELTNLLSRAAEEEFATLSLGGGGGGGTNLSNSILNNNQMQQQPPAAAALNQFNFNQLHQNIQSHQQQQQIMMMGGGGSISNNNTSVTLNSVASNNNAYPSLYSPLNSIQQSQFAPVPELATPPPPSSGGNDPTMGVPPSPWHSDPTTSVLLQSALMNGGGGGGTGQLLQSDGFFMATSELFGDVRGIPQNQNRRQNSTNGN